MSDHDDNARAAVKTKIVSDGNGGRTIKDSYLELFRKWAPTALLALCAWIGRAAVAELISLHDGQITMTGELKAVGKDAATAAAAAAAAVKQSQENEDAIKAHDAWSKQRSAEIDRRDDMQDAILKIRKLGEPKQ